MGNRKENKTAHHHDTNSHPTLAAQATDPIPHTWLSLRQAMVCGRPPLEPHLPPRISGDFMSKEVVMSSFKIKTD